MKRGRPVCHVKAVAILYKEDDKKMRFNFSSKGTIDVSKGFEADTYIEPKKEEIKCDTKDLNDNEILLVPEYGDDFKINLNCDFAFIPSELPTSINGLDGYPSHEYDIRSQLDCFAYL